MCNVTHVNILNSFEYRGIFLLLSSQYMLFIK